MAVGAFQKHVVWMVMREVLFLVTIGVVAGIAAAVALTRFVQAQLYGITAHDPMTLAAASLALTAVACAAGYISTSARQSNRRHASAAIRVARPFAESDLYEILQLASRSRTRASGAVQRGPLYNRQ